MDNWKDKILTWFSQLKSHPQKRPFLFFLIVALCAVPFILTFFTVFVGIFAILTALFFLALALMFLSPSIFKLLVQKGVLHTKKSDLIINRTLYTQIQTGDDEYSLFKVQQIPASINIKTFQSDISIEEHDNPFVEIVLRSHDNKNGGLSFFTDYDEVTSSLTIDQGPVSKNVNPVRYRMTIYIPTGAMIRILTARIVDGSINLKMKGNQPVETLDIDMVNSLLHLENLIIPILKINALNLTLTSHEIFARYLYINAAGSNLDLQFNESASQTYSGKVKCHAVLSNIYVNNVHLHKISSNNLQDIWGTDGSNRSIMLSLNILRSDLKISVK